MYCAVKYVKKWVSKQHLQVLCSSILENFLENYSLNVPYFPQQQIIITTTVYGFVCYELSELLTNKWMQYKLKFFFYFFLK